MRKLAIFCSGYAIAVLIAVFLLPQERLIPLSVLGVVIAAIPYPYGALNKKNRKRVLLCCLGLALGFLWCRGFDAVHLEPARGLDDQTVVLSGTVLEYPQPTDYGAEVLLRTELDRGSVRTLLYGGEELLLAQPGDELSVIARCTLATHTQDGEEIAYYTAKGIFLTAKTYGEPTVNRPDRLPLTAVPAVLSHRLKQSIDRVFPEDAAALVKAVVTGDREGLSDSFTASLRRTGLSHTVAVSGMHLACLAGFLSLLLGKGSRRSALVSLPLLLLFTLMVGSTPSVVRALVMVTMLQLAPLLGRERDSFTSLAFALCVLLLHNPFSAADVGLQLSFAAVAGILLCSEPLQERMLSVFPLQRAGKEPLLWLRNILVRFVASALAVTLGALVFTTPLTVLYFGQVSLIAPLSNLLALWAVTAVFVGGIAVGTFGLLLPEAAALLAWPVTLTARCLFAVVRALGSLPLASLPADGGYYLIWLILVYGLLIAAILLPGRKKGRLSVGAAAIALVAAVLFNNLEFYAGELSVQVLDVGQGQSVLLRSGDELALVDCGGDGYDNAGDVAADRIQSLGRSELDLLIVSHYHSDHANGVAQLFERLRVKKVLLPAADGSLLCQTVLKLARQEQAEICFVEADTGLAFGEDAALSVFAPLGESKDTNELGLTVLCAARDYDVLLTGDMGASQEKKLLSHADLPDVELMVAGHHGSKYANSELLLETVRPNVAVFSVGANNTYGHPTQEAVDRFLAVGAAVYRTDLNGTVTITAKQE